MQAHIGNTDIAVWRSASGKLAAWLNRCPHRGMRLSHGFVRGESLACLYHGWHYGGDGVCNYIPAHPELDPPKTIQATAYSVVDQGGVLWVSTDKDPDDHSLADDNQPVRSITFASSLKNTQNTFSGSSIADESDCDLTACEIPEYPNSFRWECKESSQSITILLQQPSERAVIAHILAGGVWSADGLVRISRWSEAVRRQAERQETAHNTSEQGGT